MQTRIASGRVYEYHKTMGLQAGFGERGFDMPVDVGVGTNGNLYVLSRSNELHQYARFTAVTMNDEIIFATGKTGEGDGEFVWPTGIALDSDDNVWISDEWLNRISIFDKNGKFLSKWGVKGSNDGELLGPSGLAFDGEGNLYISDSLNNRIQKFTKDGKFLLAWGSVGDEEGKFDKPWGITVDCQGQVFVADWGNDRVQKFTPEGDFLASFGKKSDPLRDSIKLDASIDNLFGLPKNPGKTGFGQLDGPSDVAVDEDGDIYIVDWGNDRVQIFSSDNVPVTTFTGDAEPMSKWGQEVLFANADQVRARSIAKNPEFQWRFTRPTSLAIDSVGRFIVTDTLRFRIQIYQKLRDYVEPQFNL